MYNDVCYCVLFRILTRVRRPQWHTHRLTDRPTERPNLFTIFRLVNLDILFLNKFFYLKKKKKKKKKKFTWRWVMTIIEWIHYATKDSNFLLVSCLFSFFFPPTDCVLTWAPPVRIIHLLKVTCVVVITFPARLLFPQEKSILSAPHLNRPRRRHINLTKILSLSASSLYPFGWKSVASIWLQA